MAYHPVDIHVGGRLKYFRETAKVSQKKLAAHVGISFQQIQKYETGANRIGASRLFEFGQLLDRQVGEFFTPLPGPGACGPSLATLQLAQDLDAIEDPDVLEHFYQLVMRYNAT